MSLRSCDSLAKLWSHLYPSYPLSCLRNARYHGLALLFSSCISPLKCLTSHIPHPASILSLILHSAIPTLDPLTQLACMKSTRYNFLRSHQYRVLSFLFPSFIIGLLKYRFLYALDNKCVIFNEETSWFLRKICEYFWRIHYSCQDVGQRLHWRPGHIVLPRPFRHWDTKTGVYRQLLRGFKDWRCWWDRHYGNTENTKYRDRGYPVPISRLRPSQSK